MALNPVRLRSTAGDRQRGNCLEAAHLLVPHNTLNITMISQSGFGPQNCCYPVSTEGDSEPSDSQSLRELSNVHMKVDARSLPDTYPFSASASQQTWAEGEDLQSGQVATFLPKAPLLVPGVFPPPAKPGRQLMHRPQNRPLLRGHHQDWCQSGVYTSIYYICTYIYASIYYGWPRLMLCSYIMAEGVCEVSGLFRVCFKLSTFMACCFVNAGDGLQCFNYLFTARGLITTPVNPHYFWPLLCLSQQESQQHKCLSPHNLHLCLCFASFIKILLKSK